MKRKTKWITAGIMSFLLAAAMTLTALAAEGWSIYVSPINVLIDGEVFQPKDVTGKQVPVFCYEGTTYAPLRGLAEAYGLEVDYDAASHTAMVGTQAQTTVIREPDPTARDFGYQWRIEETARIGGEVICTAVYAGPLVEDDFITWWNAYSAGEIQIHTTRLAEWTAARYPGSSVTLYFIHDSENLGTARTGGEGTNYIPA